LGTGEVQTRFWWRRLREGDHLEDPGFDGRIILLDANIPTSLKDPIKEILKVK
jgi:hypothetical protein